MMGLKLLPKQRPTPRDLPTPSSSGGTEDGGWSTKERGGFQPNPQELMDLMGCLLDELRKGRELESRVEKAEAELCRLLENGDEMSRVLLRHADAAVVVYNKLEALRQLTGHKLPPPLPSSPFSVASQSDENV